MSQKNLLSAIIIARNESVRIGACIDALSFCDEVVVADNGSTDETAKIAREHGARVVIFHSDDFADLRNNALKEARGEWILYIDADEIVESELATAIRSTTDMWRKGEATSYRVSRVNYYLGRRWPGSEYMLRLFKRDALVTWQGELHETPEVKGKIGVLSGELRHDTHRSLSEMVDKTNEWSETEAQLRYDAHHPAISWWRLLRVMMTGFWSSFIDQGGWRAGTVGWIESIYQAFSLFVTYAKLWEKQEHPKEK